MFVLRISSLLVVVAHLLSLIELTTSSNILGYLVTTSRSHFIVQDALMRGLAAKGHNVTVVGLLPAPQEVIPNYRYIQLEINDSEFGAQWMEIRDGLLGNANNENYFLRYPGLIQTFGKMSASSYLSADVQKLKREETFDLVIYGWFFNDYHVGLAAHFKCPAVVISSLPTYNLLGDHVGNPSGAAYTPAALMPFYKPVTFTQRVFNFVAMTVQKVASELVIYFHTEPFYTRHYPPSEYPSFAEARKNVALVLTTSHFSQSGPIASFPAMIEVSGIHIPHKPNELPEDIKQWLDTAPHGVIFFSMGSIIQSTDLTAEKRDAILRVFARLPQRVLWKWEDEQLPGKPDNVMIKTWLPQSDVLAHKNVLLFISHCGLGSLNEARFNGVPVLGMPVFVDQPANLKVVMEEGWAVELLYSQLTEETLEQALNEMLTNSKYGDVVRKAAQLYADRPMHPLDTAIYWLEYVIRHKGAKHMQSQAVHLNWVQYHSLDVLGFFAVIAWLLWKLTLLFWRTVFAYLFGQRSTGKTKRE